MSDIGSFRSMDKYLSNMDQRRAWAVAFFLAMVNAADAVEIMSIGFILSSESFLEASVLDKSLLSSAVFLGMFVGGVLFGNISDIYGRRPLLLGCTAVNAASGVASALAPTFGLLVFFRFFGGLAIGGSIPIMFTLGAELFPMEIRGSLISFIGSFWMVGALFTAISAWIMLGTEHSDWRHYAGVCTIPAMLSTIMTYFFIPESPRYLLQKDKIVEASEVLSKYCGMDISSDSLKKTPARNSLVNYLTEPIEETESSEASSEKSDGTYCMDIQYIKYMFSPELKNTSLILFCTWFTLAFGSYGITTWITTLYTEVGISDEYLAAVIYTTANLPGNIITIFFIEKWGRKEFLFAGMIGSGISAFGFAFGTDSAGVVIFFSFLFNMFSVIAWNSLSCFTTELFPTHIRSSSQGLLSAVGRLGAVIAQIVFADLEHSPITILLATAVCMFIGATAVYQVDVDSSGKGLVEEGDMDRSTVDADADAFEAEMTCSVDEQEDRQNNKVFNPLSK